MPRYFSSSAFHSASETESSCSARHARVHAGSTRRGVTFGDAWARRQAGAACRAGGGGWRGLGRSLRRVGPLLRGGPRCWGSPIPSVCPNRPPRFPCHAPSPCTDVVLVGRLHEFHHQILRGLHLVFDGLLDLTHFEDLECAALADGAAGLVQEVCAAASDHTSGCDAPSRRGTCRRRRAIGRWPDEFVAGWGANRKKSSSMPARRPRWPGGRRPAARRSWQHAQCCARALISR